MRWQKIRSGSYVAYHGRFELSAKQTCERKWIAIASLRTDPERRVVVHSHKTLALAKAAAWALTPHVP